MGGFCQTTLSKRQFRNKRKIMLQQTVRMLITLKNAQRERSRETIPLDAAYVNVNWNIARHLKSCNSVKLIEKTN